mgnify:CR=1 FL=1
MYDRGGFQSPGPRRLHCLQYLDRSGPLSKDDRRKYILQGTHDSKHPDSAADTRGLLQHVACFCILTVLQSDLSGN